MISPTVLPDFQGKSGRGAMSIRSREVIFLPADEAAYDDLLRAAFPNLAYVERLSDEKARAELAPDVPLLPSIRLCQGWDVRFRISDHAYPPGLSRHLNRWAENVGTWPFGLWLRANEIRDWVRGLPGRGDAPPNMAISTISYYSRRAVPEDAKAMNKAMRLVDKVGTRNYCIVKWPSMEVCEPGPGPVVIGHNAMAWLRADPSHVARLSLHSITGNYALRPGPEGQD